jgi:hypothetical protein
MRTYLVLEYRTELIDVMRLLFEGSNEKKAILAPSVLFGIYLWLT